MNAFDRQQFLAALMALVVALFVSARLPHSERWRRLLKHASIAVFLIALVAVLVEIGLWLAAPAR